MDDSRAGNDYAIAALLDSLDVPIQALIGHSQVAYIGNSSAIGSRQFANTGIGNVV